MAGTQELPSWMTLSIVTITNSEGILVTTSTTTLELPLTYYGPSVSTHSIWTIVLVAAHCLEYGKGESNRQNLQDAEAVLLLRAMCSFRSWRRQKDLTEYDN